MSNEILTKNIGIIGAGHIGQAIAIQLLNNNFPKKQLALSYNGSKDTYNQLNELNITDLVKTNDELINCSNIIILTLPPQNFKKLNKFNEFNNKVIISFMAGINFDTIQKITKSSEIIRVMPTGPDTILNGTAIAGLYPNHKLSSDLLNLIGIDFYKISNDKQMDLMILAGCLPAVYCIVNPSLEINKLAIKKLSKNYPEFIEISKKTENLVPTKDKTEFIKRVSTPNGVTESIITSIKKGNNLYDALNNGLKRNKELS